MTDERSPGGAGRRGFGVAATLCDAELRIVSRAAEDAGYATFWVNDDPDGEGLAALRAAADATSSIRLAVGLIPLDRRTPRQIAARVDALGLPTDRLTIGVGAGATPGGPSRVRAGVSALRDLTDAQLAVGALGPRMCQLAADVADVVLLDWPTPGHARTQQSEIERAAAAVERTRPVLAGYVFTALGAAAIQRLESAARHYAAVPAYAAHFRRIGIDPLEATVAGTTPTQITQGLAAFDDVWEQTVVRATVEAETSAAYLRLLTVAAPST
jgi:alkanesulfonate monooxygenase SsuD/methylene tetrahydromethanopterin reductase-like flavin-dependent oxidoreductase (luciferase family)